MLTQLRGMGIPRELEAFVRETLEDELDREDVDRLIEAAGREPASGEPLPEVLEDYFGLKLDYLEQLL